VILVVRDDRYTAGSAGQYKRRRWHGARRALISGWAPLMIAVFGASAFADIMPIPELGFGLAIAIALDATVIRPFVIPSAIKLVGEWNWWLPGRHARPLAPVPAVIPTRRQQR
jgi:RND superfamily putative drug exporter